ncbi:hypothetical protein [Desulfonatronovibrio hydrogenovorans]|uniref:hypothetical protein n=1 Tax=Desulfonatronovibrio hydrogenovorans TaxID=53245 RepID=UPI00068B611E|nr:hypothetical protein [Desulfonatronovibrio hydrogenovorans]
MKITTIKSVPELKTAQEQEFDMETLYVECSRCGRPLVWARGTTTHLIRHSGVKQELGPEWMLLSRGCPSCAPDQEEFALTLKMPEKSLTRAWAGKQRFN